MDTAKTLVAGDKGLLAMDGSNPTCNKRFASPSREMTQMKARTSGRPSASLVAPKLNEGGSKSGGGAALR